MRLVGKSIEREEEEIQKLEADSGRLLKIINYLNLQRTLDLN